MPRLSLTLDEPDHRAFSSAVRRLRRVLGDRAPDLTQLVHHQLTGRDASGLADEYLDSIGWPGTSGRSASRRLQRDPTLN